VGVSRSGRSLPHAVKKEHAPNLEGHVSTGFHRGQDPAIIIKTGQLEQANVGDTHRETTSLEM
jgi:hypothetical protein